jgi:3-keto-L-gulonate-6-phosphate decarboxylase
VADGFDAAIAGVAWTHQGPRVVYDIARCLEVLVAGGMDREEADEYLDFNVLSAYVGEQTPLFIDRAPAGR